MSFCQVQLLKWSLPAFALILGLLWYKRRRVDRVDPGGSSMSIGDTGSTNGNSVNKAILMNGNLCDSGIQTDDSFSLNTSTSPPAEEIISPRKVSESLDIPNRKNSSQSISMLSCNPKSIEFNNTSWYEDVENTPEMKEIQLGSNPTKSDFDFMSKSKSSELKNSKNSNIMENVIEEDTKVIVVKSEVLEQVTDTQGEFKTCQKPVSDDQQSNGDEKKQRQVLSERDSANHSPVSGVLDGSVTDEARSEGSTDSGKGGSIKGHPKDNNRTIYEFLVSINLVGKLIGRGGQFFQHIRNNADVGIMVKRHPTERDYKICSIDGTPENIATALEMIRQYFPEKTYPHLTLEQIIYEEILPEEIPWVPELMQLSLIEGVNNDVIVSHIVKPNHLFIQLPTHPTYPSLRILDDKMTQLYEAVESPPVPDKLSKGMIVVAKWYNKWVRVYVENPDPNGEQTLVRLVDHGGYWTFNHSDMRKIRSDYLSLPFQAIEVFLANIQPKEEDWSQDAYNIVAQICTRIVGQAQIVGYVDSSTFINLYFNIHKHGVISIADELIARGMAEPMSLEEVVSQYYPLCESKSKA